MRWMIVLLAAGGAFAGDFRVDPTSVLQGQTLKVYGGGTAQSARLQDRTIRLFAQLDGDEMGLMPIGVLLKPGGYKLEWLDSGGAVLHSMDLDVGNAHYAKQNIVLTKALTELKSTPDERASVAAFLAEVSPQRYWQEPLEAPIAGCITSPFGVERLHNGKPTGDYHAGLDQRGQAGSPVHAAAAGIVKLARQFTLRGGTVAIDHGQGLESIYLHMSGFAVKEGELVQQGAVIGYVGSTGRSTGPHLHWTLYANGQPVNPLQWISLTPCESSSSTKPRRKHPPTKAA
ncbi:MAG: M23 family metallopeptidase [Acidobacteriales bacterium]|nr:M23 family metallopeptidase [Terriglobales bacterium]